MSNASAAGEEGNITTNMIFSGLSGTTSHVRLAAVLIAEEHRAFTKVRDHVANAMKRSSAAPIPKLLVGRLQENDALLPHSQSVRVVVAAIAVDDCLARCLAMAAT